MGEQTVLTDILINRKGLKMLEEDDASGSGSELSSSPSSKGLVGQGSDLFKTVLEDYIFNETRISKTEFDRYKSRQQNKNKDSEEHGKSRRCESCHCVMAFCKCNLYSGSVERKFGHRVHWADEVWDKPLTSLLDDTSADECDNSSDNEQVNGLNGHHHDKLAQIQDAFGHIIPKPILKHKATCIVIVSE